MKGTNKINSRTIKGKIEEQKFAHEVVSSVVDSYLRQGLLKEEDFLDQKNLLKKVKELYPKNNNECSIVIVHTDALLNKARSFSRKDCDYAFIFYATYFEHFINNLIHDKCKNEKFSQDLYKVLVKKLSMEDKFTWVIEMLRLPKFDSKHWSVIKKISENRNAFVHYKYTPRLMDEDDELTKVEWDKVVKELKDTIRYCKAYEARVVYKGKKSALCLSKK